MNETATHVIDRLLRALCPTVDDLRHLAAEVDDDLLDFLPGDAASPARVRTALVERLVSHGLVHQTLLIAERQRPRQRSEIMRYARLLRSRVSTDVIVHRQPAEPLATDGTLRVEVPDHGELNLLRYLADLVDSAGGRDHAGHARRLRDYGRGRHPFLLLRRGQRESSLHAYPAFNTGSDFDETRHHLQLPVTNLTTSLFCPFGYRHPGPKFRLDIHPGKHIVVDISLLDAHEGAPLRLRICTPEESP